MKIKIRKILMLSLLALTVSTATALEDEFPIREKLFSECYASRLPATLALFGRAIGAFERNEVQAARERVKSLVHSSDQQPVVLPSKDILCEIIVNTTSPHFRERAAELRRAFSDDQKG